MDTIQKLQKDLQPIVKSLSTQDFRSFVNQHADPISSFGLTPAIDNCMILVNAYENEQERMKAEKSKKTKVLEALYVELSQNVEELYNEVVRIKLNLMAS